MAARSTPIASTRGASAQGGMEAALTASVETPSSLLSALESVDAAARMIACISIAGIFEGAQEEAVRQAVSFFSNGGARALIKRLLDADTRVRLHALGAIKNACLMSDAEDAPTVAVCLAEDAPAAVATAVRDAVTTPVTDGASRASSTSMLSVQASVAAEGLALLTLLAESSDTAMARVLTLCSTTLLSTLSSTPLPPSLSAAPPAGTLAASVPRVRFAACKLLHVLSEHNEPFAAFVRGNADAKRLLGGLAHCADEHVLVRIHAAGVLANVYLQPVVRVADVATLARTEVEAALAAVLSVIREAIVWQPLPALDSVRTAYSHGVAAYMRVRATVDAAERAQKAWEAGASASAMRRGAQAAVADMASGKVGMHAGDGDEDADSSAAGASVEGGAASAGAGVGGKPVEVVAHEEAVLAARAARASYHAARTSWLEMAQAVCVALELLANVVGGADEEQGGEEEEDEEEEEDGEEAAYTAAAHAAAAPAAAALDADTLSARDVPALVVSQLVTSGAELVRMLGAARHELRHNERWHVTCRQGVRIQSGCSGSSRGVRGGGV
ncbi:hypothetical protein EON68_01650, partial [archaeon]